MNHVQIKHVCQTLDLGKSKSTPVRVYGGLLHLMWRLETERGSYAVKQLRLLPPETKKNYEFTEKIANRFQELGVPAISALEFEQGKHLIESDDATFLVYPWTNAKTLDPVTSKFAVKIAQILAKMHLINLQIPELEDPTFDVSESDEISSLIAQSKTQ